MDRRYREWNFEEDRKEDTVITAFFKAAALLAMFMFMMIMSAAFI